MSSVTFKSVLCFLWSSVSFLAAVTASLSFHLLFFLLSLFLLFVNSLSNEPVSPPCPLFKCGNFTNISSPFTDIENPNCGSIFLECFFNETKIRSLDDREYIVKNVSNSDDHSIAIQDPLLTGKLRGGTCDLVSEFVLPNFHNLFLNTSTPIISILICKPDSHLDFLRYPSIRNHTNCNDSYHLYYSRPRLFKDKAQQGEVFDATQHDCKPVPYPLSVMPNDWEWGGFDLISSLEDGFVLQWIRNDDCATCQFNGGLCLVDELNNFSCHCVDELYGKNCTSGNKDQEFAGRKSQTWLKVIIGSTAAVGMIILAVLLLFVLRWISQSTSLILISKKPKCSIDFEKVLKNYGNQMPKRYSYSDIRRMTNFMKCKLGEGGYGSVFKGQLLDGSPVAVKILSDAKGKGDDFINEVATIGRTAHVNIVRLMGFCWEGSRRALIYEFMPNGSLEKFIFAENPKKGPLGWEKLFKIALGIARGLEYLHRGCNTRILHFDIKPHNILLDQDFCPKISDFGLAKLCPDKKSIVSMTGARGTVGYIAPELVSRNFGMVSNKSDVYSYGMLLLEMVGGRKNVDAQVDNTSEIYFPDWIYKHLEEDSDLLLGEITTHREDEIARKMIIVGLWCIQTKPANRPTMSKVLEMLEGNIQGLQIPPKPYFSTPSESENTISTNC